MLDNVEKRFETDIHTYKNRKLFRVSWCAIMKRLKIAIHITYKRLLIRLHFPHHSVKGRHAKPNSENLVWLLPWEMRVMRPHTAWGLPTTVTALREPSNMNQHKMATSLNSDPLQQTDSCLNYFLVPWSAFLLICT